MSLQKPALLLGIWRRERYSNLEAARRGELDTKVVGKHWADNVLPHFLGADKLDVATILERFPEGVKKGHGKKKTEKNHTNQKNGRKLRNSAQGHYKDKNRKSSACKKFQILDTKRVADSRMH